MKYNLLLLLALLCGCADDDDTLEQIEKMKAPVVIYAIHKSTGFFDEDRIIVRDGNGKLIELNDGYKYALVDSYQIGDTIK